MYAGQLIVFVAMVLKYRKLWWADQVAWTLEIKIKKESWWRKGF